MFSFEGLRRRRKGAVHFTYEDLRVGRRRLLRLGYCAVSFATGHQVAIADNFARRQWDYELGVQTLTPIRPMPERLSAWRQCTGENIEFLLGDVTDYDFLGGAMRIRARRRGALRRAAGRAVLDDRPQACGIHPSQQRGGNAQPAVCAARIPARLPPGETRDDGRIRHARTSTSKKAISRSSTTAAKTCCRSPSSPALSITSRRCMTATTSCSPARSGACAPPI